MCIQRATYVHDSAHDRVVIRSGGKRVRCATVLYRFCALYISPLYGSFRKCCKSSGIGLFEARTHENIRYLDLAQGDKHSNEFRLFVCTKRAPGDKPYLPIRRYSRFHVGFVVIPVSLSIGTTMLYVRLNSYLIKYF